MSDPSTALHLDDDNPWPGLAQYTEATKSYFFGRDHEVADVVRLVGLAPFVMVYGKSGLGKSSMLQAGAFPKLREARFLPVYLRLNYDEGAEPPLQQALARLTQEIAAAGLDAPTPASNEGLWEYLQRRERPIWTADNFPLTPVLVFDQFEEVFSHGGSSEHVKKVLDEIADLAGNRLPSALADDPGVAERLNLQTQQYRVVLSFRSDFLANVASWERQASLPRHEALDLEPMSREVAIEAVQNAGKAVLEPGVAEKIVDFVLDRDDAGGGGRAAEVEPVLLSLCCFQLNNRRTRPGKIDAGLVEKAGQDILLDFYGDALAGTEPRVGVFIEDNLIQGGRYRSSFPRDEALASGALTSDDLETLQKRRLLRVDVQGGVPRIELIHDRLVGVVRDKREARGARERVEAERQAEARQAEEARRAAALAQAQRDAETADQLKQAAEREKDAAERLQLAAERETRRIRKWRNAMFGVVLLLVIALGSVVYFADQAETRKGLAEANAYLFRVLLLVADSQAMLAGSKRGDDEQAFQQLLAARLLWDDPRTEGPMFEALNARQHLMRFESLEVKTGSDPIALAFGPDGKVVAAGHADGSVSLRDISNPGNPVTVAAGHGDLIQGIAFSRDGKRIVTASNDGTLRRWQAQPLRAEGEPMRGHKGTVYGVAISPDGRRVASAGRDGTVRLWDAASGAELARARPLPPGRVFGVAFNPADGSSLAVVTAASGTTKTSSLIVLDAATLAIKGGPFFAHSQDAFALAYSPSGRYVVTGGADDVVRVRDLSGDLAAIVSMSGRGGGDLQTVAFSPDERWAAGGSVDGGVRLWTAATGEPLALPPILHQGAVTSVTFSPRGDWLVSGAEDRTMRLWPLDPTWNIRNRGAAPDGVLGVAIGRTGSRALFGLASGALSLRDEGSEPRIFPLPGDSSADGAPLTRCKPAPAPEPQAQSARSAQVASPAARATPHAARTVWLQGDGRTALSGHEDGSLRRWDLDAGIPVGAPLRVSECALVALAASADRKRVAVADREGTVLVLDGAGKVLEIHASHGQVTALALAADGQKLVVGGGEPPSLKLYTAGQPKPEPMGGVLEAPTSLTFGPGDTVVVSGSAKGNVRLWDVARRVPLTAPQGAGPDAVLALDYGGDGMRFYSAGGDGAARPWAARASWAELMCRKISANPSRKSWREWVSIELPYRCVCPDLKIEPDDPAKPPAQPDACPRGG